MSHFANFLSRDESYVLSKIFPLFLFRSPCFETDSAAKVNPSNMTTLKASDRSKSALCSHNYLA